MDMSSVGEKMEQLVAIMATLRSEKGCPWDRAQNEKTIINFFLEEAYELAEAVLAGKPEQVAEELGDILMEVVFLAQLYKEKNAFSLESVLEGINQKMLRRHPHVFGPKPLASAEEVVGEWVKIKEKEKPDTSGLDPLAGIARNMPALMEAYLLGFRASQFGFDWSSAGEALAKVEEELKELKEVLVVNQESAQRQEVGDLFFSLVNVCRLAGINPELALKQANQKFRARFLSLFAELKKKGKDMNQVSLEEMNELWEKVKSREEKNG